MHKHLAWLVILMGVVPYACSLFSDREWYCRNAAEGVPPASAHRVYEYCVKEGYDEHLREERRCAEAGRACCAAYCSCRKARNERECHEQLQRCAKPHGCFFLLASDCKC